MSAVRDQAGQHVYSQEHVDQQRMVNCVLSSDVERFGLNMDCAGSGLPRDTLKPVQFLSESMGLQCQMFQLRPWHSSSLSAHGFLICPISINIISCSFFIFLAYMLMINEVPGCRIFMPTNLDTNMSFLFSITPSPKSFPREQSDVGLFMPKAGAFGQHSSQNLRLFINGAYR